MRITARLALCALLLAASCKTTQTPPPEGPDKADQKESQGGAPAGGEAAAPAAGESSAPTGDIAGEVILTLTGNSLDAALQQGLSYVRPHLPPAFAAMLRPSMLKGQLFKVLRMPQLETVVDTGRPMALAVVDPETYRGGGRLGSTILAVPVTDQQALADALGQVADRHERTPWGDHRFSFGSDTLHLRFANQYALLAGQEQLINGASGVLLPLIEKQGNAGSTARLRIDLATINRLYGAQIERGLTRMKRQMARKPQVAGVARMIARWMGYLKSSEDAVVELKLDPGAIRALGTVTATAGGELAAYMGKMRSGPAWGAKYLPTDSGLIFLTNQSPDAMIESIDEGVETLKGMLQGMVPDDALTRIRDHARDSVKYLSGESAGAMWVDAGGGLGFGSATRVKDVAAAQAAMVRMTQLFAKELKRLFAKGLPPKVKNELKGASLAVRVRPRGLRVAGLQGALVQLDIRWPRLKDPRERKKMQKLRRGLTKVMGPRLTLALVGTGDVLLLTGGKDYRRRMAQMVAIAKGGQGTGMEQTVSKLVGSRRIVALVHTPLATLAEQVMRLVEQLTPVPARVKDAFQKMLPQPGNTSPMTAVVQVEGPRLQLQLEISPEVVGMITRGALAASRASAMQPPPAP